MNIKVQAARLTLQKGSFSSLLQPRLPPTHDSTFMEFLERATRGELVFHVQLQFYNIPVYFFQHFFWLHARTF